MTLFAQSLEDACNLWLRPYLPVTRLLHKLKVFKDYWGEKKDNNFIGRPLEGGE